jgi:hypothetical protein
VGFNEVRYEPRVWTCGNRFVKAWNSGCRSAGSSTTVSHSAACQPSGGRSAAGRVLPQRRSSTGSGTGEALVAFDQLAQPGSRQAASVERLFALNRRILKAYLLKESLSHLWDYSYEGAMLPYLQKWIDQQSDGTVGGQDPEQLHHRSSYQRQRGARMPV